MEIESGDRICQKRNRKHRNLARCTVGLHQSAAEVSLLIRCRILSSEREANPIGLDSSSKIMELESTNPDASTQAREICCLFLADSAKVMIDDPTVSWVRPGSAAILNRGTRTLL